MKRFTNDQMSSEGSSWLVNTKLYSMSWMGLECFFTLGGLPGQFIPNQRAPRSSYSVREERERGAEASMQCKAVSRMSPMNSHCKAVNGMDGKKA